MLYVSFFPHLVASPIVHASYLLPQFEKPRVIIPEQVANGVWLILLGYVKKVVIADRLAHITGWGFFGGTIQFHDMNAWIAVYAFAFQIYGDFSGYSDIARGLSKLMGYELVVNFKAPYLVSNPAVFWKNWHISLSEWLRDYLYIPLGGNRGSAISTHRNLLVTMLLGGLWHGAGAAFVLWGLFQGALLSVHRAWSNIAGVRFPSKQNSEVRTIKSPIGKTLEIAKVICFFHIICIGWLLFMAGSLPGTINQTQRAWDFLAAMFHPCSFDRLDPLFWPVLLLGALCLLFQWKHRQMDNFARWPVGIQAGCVLLAISLIAAFGVFEGAQFIYFQF